MLSNTMDAIGTAAVTKIFGAQPAPSAGTHLNISDIESIEDLQGRADRLKSQVKRARESDPPLTLATMGGVGLGLAIGLWII